MNSGKIKIIKLFRGFRFSTRSNLTKTSTWPRSGVSFVHRQSGHAGGRTDRHVTC